MILGKKFQKMAKEIYHLRFFNKKVLFSASSQNDQFLNFVVLRPSVFEKQNHEVLKFLKKMVTKIHFCS